MQTLCKLHGSAGIAHMDVKPENILLAHAEDNAWNRLRLIDFGLSAKSGTAAHNRIFHSSKFQQDFNSSHLPASCRVKDFGDIALACQFIPSIVTSLKRSNEP